MRPDQCGTGRDLPEVRAFAHDLALYAIMTGRTRKQLATGPAYPPVPFHVGQLVKVTGHTVFAGREQYGRIGRVDHVYDYRDVIQGDESVVVDLVMLSGRGQDGKPVWDTLRTPFWLHEIAPLHQAAGDWTRHVRAVSPQNWPAARDGMSA